MPDFRLAGKRRNQKPIQELVALMGRWKNGDRAQLDTAERAWLPLVRDGVFSRVPADAAAFSQAKFIAVRGMEGSVLATARRKSPTAPNDAPANSVAAMHYSATNGVTDNPLANVLASWVFAVGYWAYHQLDVQAAANRALAVLDDPNLPDALSTLTAEPRFLPR